MENSFLFFTLKGFQQQQLMPGLGARHMAPPAGGRPPKTVAPSHAEEKQQANQRKPRVPELEKHLVDQLSTEEVNSLNSKFKEATEADKKVLRTLMFPQFSHLEQQSYVCMLLPDKCQIITNIPKTWRKKFWMLERKLNISGSKCSSAIELVMYLLYFISLCMHLAFSPFCFSFSLLRGV